MAIIGKFLDNLEALHTAEPIHDLQIVREGAYEQAIINAAREFGGINELPSVHKDMGVHPGFDDLNTEVVRLLQEHGVSYIHDPSNTSEQVKHEQGIDLAAEIYDDSDRDYIAQHRAYYTWLKSQNALEPGRIFDDYEAQTEIDYEVQQAS